MKVCDKCFNDIELKHYIVSNSDEKGKCDYCSEGINSPLLEVGELLDFFAEFISIFKFDDDGIPLIELIQKDWDLFSGKSTGHDILLDVLATLYSSISNPQDNVNYIDEIIESTSYWNILKEDLKWNRRFLTDIEEIKDLGWDSLFLKKESLSLDEPFYRARIHIIGESKPFKIDEMGNPPKNTVMSGRANPLGIPYLYLCKKIETTFYEIRATYLDEVSIGEFHVKMDNKIDVIDFTEKGSAFLNMENLLPYTKSVFLKKEISIDLSKPITRFDSELEYIPTQFICEFIRYITGADGILFNSSLHKGGKNIVLFDQDKVECISVTKYRVTRVEIEAKEI